MHSWDQRETQKWRHLDFLCLWMLPSLPVLYFWLRMLGLPPAFRRKLCSVLSWYLVPRYSSSVFQPRKQTCGVSFIELLTVSLVNTGSWMTVPKCNRWQASFLEIRPFLTTLPRITDLLFSVVVVVVFTPCVLPNFCLEKKKKKGEYIWSPLVLTPCDRDEGKYFNI